jgi:hypothetical protein
LIVAPIIFLFYSFPGFAVLNRAGCRRLFQKATQAAISRIDRIPDSGEVPFPARFCCASGRGVARGGGSRKLGNAGGLRYVADPNGKAGVRWPHELFADIRLFTHSHASAHNRSRTLYFGGSFGDRKP